MTRGAAELLGRVGKDPLQYIHIHVGLVKGQMCDEDHAANVHAAENGLRVFSRFEVAANEFIYVITEADRSVTTILLPSEY
jgi:hypothetical protein